MDLLLRPIVACQDAQGNETLRDINLRIVTAFSHKITVLSHKPAHTVADAMNLQFGLAGQ